MRLGRHSAASRLELTDLLHNASLSFGKGNVSTRLIRDELDVNLPAFAIRLIVVVVIVIAGGGTDTRALHAARLSTLAIGIAGGQSVIADRRRLLFIGIVDIAHDGMEGTSTSSDKVVVRVNGGQSQRGMMLTVPTD